jgi:hypothetical protein
MRHRGGVLRGGIGRDVEGSAADKTNFAMGTVYSLTAQLLSLRKRATEAG